jgi:hypothetical protein
VPDRSRGADYRCWDQAPGVPVLREAPSVAERKPFLDSHLVLRPGQRNAIKISRGKYAQLQSAGLAGSCPDWLASAVRRSWGMDVGGRPLGDFAIVRAPSPLGYGRPSYELNMGCNYDCTATSA